MLENMRVMKCGACGNSTMILFTNDKTKEIHVECQSCVSVSIIKPTAPKLEIEWGKDAEGILTVFK